MKKSNKLTHFDNNGKAIMVDISNKEITERIATAAATIKMGKKTFEMIKKGTAKKGDVLGVARLQELWQQKKHQNLFLYVILYLSHLYQ